MGEILSRQIGKMNSETVRATASRLTLGTADFQQHPEESSIEKPTPQANLEETIQTTK